jgi:hypothetical protein
MMKKTGLFCMCLFPAIITACDSSTNTAAPVVIPQASAQMSIEVGTASNIVRPTLYVSGAAVSTYRYKVVSSLSECRTEDGYSNDQLSGSTQEIDISGRPNGAINLCVIGKDISGASQPFDQATTLSWVKIPNPTVSVADVRRVQGEAVSFIVTQSSVSALPTLVQYATEDSANNPAYTAVAGADFTGDSGTFEIPAGQLTTVFTIESLAISPGSPQKSFGIRFSNPLNAFLASQTVTAILDPALTNN